MADRTFTAEDVLRIYEFHLSRSEMETVEEFFAGEQAQMDFTFLTNLVEFLADLLLLLPRLTALAATFAPFVLAALNEAIRELNLAIRFIGPLSNDGGVDA